MMAFIIFNRIQDKDGSSILQSTGELFHLGGRNLLYQAWEKRNRPLDQGWHVSADELIQMYSNDHHTYDTMRMIIDFDPDARWRIGLVELLEIHAYTWGNGNQKASWTPLMLHLQNVFYEEFDPEISDKKKKEILHKIREPQNRSEFVEFLYLQGSDNAWNWGRNGATNAAFIEGEARVYFRQFF